MQHKALDERQHRSAERLRVDVRRQLTARVAAIIALVTGSIGARPSVMTCSIFGLCNASAHTCTFTPPTPLLARMASHARVLPGKSAKRLQRVAHGERTFEQRSFGVMTLVGVASMIASLLAKSTCRSHLRSVPTR